jgi:dTMP kinase
MTLSATSGFFATFEGLDGSGKSTQLRRLAAVLRAQGLAVLETRQPGGTALGERVRGLLVEAKAGSEIAPLAELAMMFADRAQAIAEVIAPALASGEIVLCDRFTDSTEAYQGGGRALGAPIVHTLHHGLCGGLQPDLTILLLPPMEVSLHRARRRNERHESQTGQSESRFEQEADAFFQRTYRQYQAIAQRELLRVVVIDQDEPIEVIHARIVGVVEERLAAWKRSSRLGTDGDERTP